MSKRTKKWGRLVEVRRPINDPEGWYIKESVQILNRGPEGETEFDLFGEYRVKWVYVEVEV